MLGNGNRKSLPPTKCVPCEVGGGGLRGKFTRQSLRSEQSPEDRTTQKICGRKQLTSVNSDHKSRPFGPCRSFCRQIRWPGGGAEGRVGLCAEDVTEAVPMIVHMGETEACKSSGVR